LEIKNITVVEISLTTLGLLNMTYMEERHEFEKTIAVLEWRVRFWKRQTLFYGYSLLIVALLLLLMIKAIFNSANPENWIKRQEELGWKCEPIEKKAK
jgi:hypothetical protein